MLLAQIKFDTRMQYWFIFFTNLILQLLLKFDYVLDHTVFMETNCQAPHAFLCFYILHIELKVVSFYLELYVHMILRQSKYI